MKVPGEAHYKGDVTPYLDEAPRLMGPRTFDNRLLLADVWTYDKDTDTTTVKFRTISDE